MRVANPQNCDFHDAVLARKIEILKMLLTQWITLTRRRFPAKLNRVSRCSFEEHLVRPGKGWSGGHSIARKQAIHCHVKVARSIIVWYCLVIADVRLGSEAIILKHLVTAHYDLTHRCGRWEIYPDPLLGAATWRVNTVMVSFRIMVLKKIRTTTSTVCEDRCWELQGIDKRALCD